MGEVEAGQPITELLQDAWGVAPASVEAMPARRLNRHWRVETSAGPFVLRCYSRLRLDQAIPSEFAVLAAAADTGWPVAMPVSARDGHTVVQHRNERYSLFPFLPGKPAPAAAANTANLHINGRLLARLHRDLVGALESQRPGFGRVWELDVTIQSAGGESFNAALAAFAGEYRDLAAAVRRQRYRNLRELARLGYGDLPSTVIHGHLTAANLLFEGPTLTGVLDFDDLRLDAPAVDIAECLLHDGATEGTYRLDAQAAVAFVEGYARVRPLSWTELDLVPALMRAALLRGVAIQLALWLVGATDAAVQDIEQTVSERFPALEEAAPELQRMLAATRR